MLFSLGFYSEMDHNRAAGEPIKAISQDVGACSRHTLLLREPILRPFEEVDRWMERGWGGKERGGG